MKQVKVTLEWILELPDDDRYPADLEEAVELYVQRRARTPMIFLMKEITITDVEEVMPWEKTSYI